MSGPGAPLLNEDDAALAAEHAMGLLDGSARREAETRVGRDPAFAAEVRAWSERLAPLAEEAAPVPPPASAWRGISRRLDAGRATARGGAANDNMRELRFWRRLAIGASGLAAASVTAVVLLLARPEPQAAQVAALAGQGGATALVVAFDEGKGALLVTPGPGLRPEGHTPHLWLVRPDGGVQLIGAIDPGKAATHQLPRALSRRAGEASGLALSLEPPGHHPIDKPGGPVVAKGAFSEL